MSPDPWEKWWGLCLLLPGWTSYDPEFDFSNKNEYSLSCMEIEYMQFYPNGCCRAALPVGEESSPTFHDYDDAKVFSFEEENA